MSTTVDECEPLLRAQVIAMWNSGRTPEAAVLRDFLSAWIRDNGFEAQFLAHRAHLSIRTVERLLAGQLTSVRRDTLNALMGAVRQGEELVALRPAEGATMAMLDSP